MASKCLALVTLLFLLTKDLTKEGAWKVEAISDSIHDGHRSTSSSSAFFNLLDGNGDGLMTASEISRFIRERFRGDDRLDEESEIDKAVKSVVSKLDLHEDGSLSLSDMNSHLLNLDSLLNLDETYDWIVHACQLPDSVGNVFRFNRITGSEFAELIENNGEALEDELKIQKQTWRKKLLKHMRLKLLGIGSVPSTVADRTLKIEPPPLTACDVITVDWEGLHDTSTSIFPIHSYRLQRKITRTSSPYGVLPYVPEVGIIGGEGNGNDTVESGRVGMERGGEEVVNGGVTGGEVIVKPPLSNVNPYKWHDVYVGIENSYVDIQLLTSTKYEYRVQAWNSVGRSRWTVAKYETPGEEVEGCMKIGNGKIKGKEESTSSPSSSFISYSSTSQESDKPWAWQYVSNMYFTTQVVMGLFQGFFTFIALLAGFMRLKRGSSTSTGFGIKQLTVFPWLWRGCNKVTRYTFGIDIIPSAMLEDANDRGGGDGMGVDATYGMKGLAGTGDNVDADGRKTDNTFAKHMELRKSIISPPKNNAENVLAMASEEEEESKGRLTPQNAPTTQATTSRRISFFKSKSTTNMPSSPSNPLYTPKSFLTSATKSGVSTPPPTCIPASGTAGKSVPPITAMNSSPGGNHERYWDDYTRCNVCEKKFKFLIRHRHHCARCLSAFCHKHGKTTHSNITSCRVPGSCICNRCIYLEEQVALKTRTVKVKRTASK
mmetsp:Transcript_24032/g.50100  ORF Transcript_24032/g.50100 Transcript_24032/m.50100 type:complete len:715 (+) Transcript_24032:298-2442(+)